MKYHATPTTILISILVVLLFVGVSFFILTQLNLTSPTLITTNYLFEEFANIDSDIGFSFTSIERNLRDGISINDIELTYRGDRLLYFEKVSLNRGIFSLISYVLSGQDSMGIKAVNGSFIMPKFESSNSTATNDTPIGFDFNQEFSIQIPEVLNRWGFDLSIENLSIQLSEKLNIDHSNIGIVWKNGIENSSLKIVLPETSYSSDDAIFIARDFVFTLAERDGLNVDFSVEALSIDGFGLNSSAADIAFETSISDLNKIKIADIPVSFSLQDLSAKYDDISLSSRKIAGNLSAKEASADLGNVSFVYGDISTYFKNASIQSDDLKNIELYLESINVNNKGNLLLIVPEMIAKGNVDNMIASVEIPTINSGNLISLTGEYISKATIENILLSATYGEVIELSLSADGSIMSPNSFIDGTSLSTNVNVSLIENELSNISATISDLYLPEFDSPININFSKDKDDYLANISFDDNFIADIKFDGNLSANVGFNNFSIKTIDHLIDAFASPLKGYIADTTMLNGEISANLYRSEESKIGFNGPVGYDFTLSDINYNDYLFNIDSNLSAMLVDSGISIDMLDLETQWFDLLYGGSFEYENLLPSGNLNILSADRESKYLNIDLFPSDIKEYSFFVNTSMARDTNIYGYVNFADSDMISSEFQLSVLGSSFPLDMRLNLAESDFSLYNDRLDLSVNWLDKLTVDFMLDKFQLTEETPEFVPSSITGNITLAFDFAEQDFALDIPYFYLDDLNRLPGKPDIYITAVGDNSGIQISEFNVDSDEYLRLTGNGVIDFRDFSIAFALSDGVVDGEKYMLSVIEHDGQYVGSIRLDNVAMGRLGLEDMVGQFNLTGKAAKIEDFAFSGKFEAASTDPTNDYRKIYADIYIDDTYIDFTDITYSNDTIFVGIENFEFDSSTGILELDNCNAAITVSQADGPFIINGGLSLEAYLPPSDSVVNSITQLISLKGADLEFGGTLDYAGLDEKIFASKKSFVGRYDGSKLIFDGEFLDGTYSFGEGDIDLRLNIDPIVDVQLIGDFKVDAKYDLQIVVNKLETSFVNYIFSQPVVQFHPGYFLYGNLYLSPNEEGFTLRGNVQTDYTELDIFWLPDQKVILHDLDFVVWDNDFENVTCNATVVDLNTYERIPTDVKFGINFSDSFAYEDWELDVYIDEEHLIDFRFPLSTSNIDIVGKVNGHLGIYGFGFETQISGEVGVADTTLSLGMNPIPAWYNPTGKTEVSLDVDINENVQFVFPLGPNPILRTNIADDSHINFEMGSNGLKAGGEIPLRSGEIFYFQKYFYITEGNIKLRQGATGLDPVINLRARLRDFDQNGEKIDIYLVLREATLNNISPTLESSPSKDMNELMSILGNSILPTSTTQSGSSVEAVASLAAASVDILQKFGLIGGNGMSIDSTIRNALSLDTFSLHSNIVANLLSDTVSLAGFSSSSPYSPMARYLDGTTLYLGKYLTPDIYLQSLIHLSADRGHEKNGFAFIADDLLLDTEISLEWTNPLVTVTFSTNPSNFTLYDLMDNFGFTLQKRILF